jgi:excisionase family DNA binding protein
VARHRVNPRLVKIHRTYTVEEAARTLKVHKNTVRNWIKSGLPIIDDRRPTLIHGADLRCFLEARRQRAKQPCPPGYFYCVRCRAPKAPAGGMADYVPMTPSSGNLRGICPDCETLIHRRVALRGIDAIRADLEIAFPEAPSRIRDSAVASVNCDSGEGAEAYEDA